MNEQQVSYLLFGVVCAATYLWIQWRFFKPQKNSYENFDSNEEGKLSKTMFELMMKEIHDNYGKDNVNEIVKDLRERTEGYGSENYNKSKLIKQV